MKLRDPKTGKFVRTTPDYKALYEQVEQEAKGLRSDNLTWRQMLKREHEVVEFMLKRSPFWVRWMYRKKFEKGK